MADYGEVLSRVCNDVNKTDRPNTTPTVRAICTFALYFSVFRPFCHFTLVYEVSKYLLLKYNIYCECVAYSHSVQCDAGSGYD